MMPPHYLSHIAEQRMRELQQLGEPFVVPAPILSFRARLANSLIRLGQALAIPDPPSPSGDASRVGLPTQ